MEKAINEPPSFSSSVVANMNANAAAVISEPCSEKNVTADEPSFPTVSSGETVSGGETASGGEKVSGGDRVRVAESDGSSTDSSSGDPFGHLSNIAYGQRLLLDSIQKVGYLSEPFDFLEGELYVFSSNDSEIKVFKLAELYNPKSMTPNLCTLTTARHFAVAGNPVVTSMQICELNRLLYLTDKRTDILLTVNPEDGKIIKSFPLATDLDLVFTTIDHSTGKILIPCSRDRDFVEYTAEGVLLRRVSLNDFLIEGTGTQFTVLTSCHGTYYVFHHYQTSNDKHPDKLAEVDVEDDGSIKVLVNRLITVENVRQRLMPYDAVCCLGTFEWKDKENFIHILGEDLQSAFSIQLISTDRPFTNRFPFRVHVAAGKLIVNDHSELWYFDLLEY